MGSTQSFVIVNYNHYNYVSRSRHQTTNIPNILFVYFYIDFFVKLIFFEARLESVIDGAAEYWSYF